MKYCFKVPLKYHQNDQHFWGVQKKFFCAMKKFTLLGLWKALMLDRKNIFFAISGLQNLWIFCGNFAVCCNFVVTLLPGLKKFCGQPDIAKNILQSQHQNFSWPQNCNRPQNFCIVPKNFKTRMTAKSPPPPAFPSGRKKKTAPSCPLAKEGVGAVVLAYIFYVG